eukprot:TRINITY_DN7300_c0_g2_i1.p1 TRINITY_DN7300_c0_g2~~TRINITY_DN7300_c0_g2_i1.p1  ORF type:complete len:490 (-),score=128.83 TRINITY_DN7300_c0_g2_i1:170-1564(-)
MAGLKGCFPIAELSSYTKGWKIRARVTLKGPLRTFKAKSGTGEEGKVFHVDLLDCEGGDIRCNFFNQAVDLYHDKLQVGKCFEFSKGSLRLAKREYNRTSHKYEIIFDKEAIVEEVADDAGIDALKCVFSGLRSVASKTLPCTVDLCGVVVSFKQPVSFTSKDGKELVKREIIVADDTATSMSVTLWGERAQKEDKVFDDNPVICLKGVSVKEWNGSRAGSLISDGALLFDYKGAEVDRVREWWSSGGSSATLTALSQEGSAGVPRAPRGRPASLTDVRMAAEQGVADQEIFSVVCRLAVVQTKKQGESQPLYYMACQEPKQNNNLPCNRRVDQSNYCATCGKAGKVAPRLNLRCKFTDAKDSAWLTTFHEGAQRVINMEASAVKELEEKSREDLETAVRNSYFQQPFQVTIRAKAEVYNNEQRTNVSCIEARPVPRGEHGRFLLAELKTMLEKEALASSAGGA